MGKYSWIGRKYWLAWMKQDFKRLFYNIAYGFKMRGVGATLLPKTGKGKFVSVYTKGQIIQIKSEEGYTDVPYDEIRIIPCQYNHGIMVERFKENKLKDRNLLSMQQFSKDIIFASNVEQLSGQK